MAEWALVEEGQIIELHDQLPQNWRNVSGLAAAYEDLTFLRSLGWTPVTKIHEQYDDTSYHVTGYTYRVDGDDVVEELVLESIPTPVPVVDGEVVSDVQSVVNMRATRNDLLKQSDWTQFADVQQTLSDEKQQQILEYRQKLRDLPSTYVPGTPPEWPFNPMG